MFNLMKEYRKTFNSFVLKNERYFKETEGLKSVKVKAEAYLEISQKSMMTFCLRK